jgi:hypothetical protein
MSTNGHQHEPFFTQQIICQILTSVFAFTIFFWWISSTGPGRAWSDYPAPPPVNALSMWHEPPPPVPPVPRSIGPAPTLKRGPTQAVGHHKKATWIVSGAGDNSYNGTYVEVPGGFVNRPGRYLYREPFLATWALSPTLGSPGGAMYTGGSKELPGNPWTSWLRWPDLIGEAAPSTLTACTRSCDT